MYEIGSEAYIPLGIMVFAAGTLIAGMVWQFISELRS